jgi:hypothetical protein
MSNEKRPLLSDGELGARKQRFGALNNGDVESTVSRRSEPTVGYKSDNNGFDAVSIDEPLGGKAGSSTRRVCARTSYAKFSCEQRRTIDTDMAQHQCVRLEKVETRRSRQCHRISESCGR